MESKLMVKLNKLTIASIFLLIIGMVFVLTGCESTSVAENRADAMKPTVAENNLRPVRVADAVAGDVQEFILRVTTITAPDTINLLPKIGGQIIYFDAEEGMHVKAGHVIARLEAKKLRLEAEKAKAFRDKTKHDMELALRQYEADVIGKEEYLLNKHQFEQAERDYEQAKLELDKAEIRAPISGVISHKLVSLGDMVFPSSTIVTITDPSRLEADLLIPQDQIDRVKVGNPVIFLAGGDEHRSFKGVVERISPIIEVDNGTIKIVARILPGQRYVIPGQFVKAYIVTGTQRNAVLVPREAIVDENAMSVLYKIVDGYARRIPVEIGFPKDNLIQVKGDIAQGDQVVISGINGLDDMSAVTILPPLNKATGEKEVE